MPTCLRLVPVHIGETGQAGELLARSNMFWGLVWCEVSCILPEYIHSNISIQLKEIYQLIILKNVLSKSSL